MCTKKKKEVVVHWGGEILFLCWTCKKKTPNLYTYMYVGVKVVLTEKYMPNTVCNLNRHLIRDGEKQIKLKGLCNSLVKPHNFHKSTA